MGTEETVRGNKVNEEEAGKLTALYEKAKMKKYRKGNSGSVCLCFPSGRSEDDTGVPHMEPPCLSLPPSILTIPLYRLSLAITPSLSSF